jgi:hypothetical protein
VPNSSGDEAGTAGGVVSGVNMNQCQPRQSSQKVIAGGKKMVMLTAVTSHNGSNANMPAGVHTVPSQGKVLIGM